MRRYLLPISAITAAVLILAQPVAAQEKEEKMEKKEKVEKAEKAEKAERAEKAEKPRTSSNEEIVIKRKTDKDDKVVIEIKGDEITVNGKPIDEFDDDNIVVRKRKSGVTVYSPFRAQGGALAFGDNRMLFDNDNGNIFNSGKTAFLGVSTEQVDKGVKIEEVTEGSAAEKAGLKEGDIITRVDKDQIEDPEDLTKAITSHKPDDKVTISYLRNGKSDKVTVTLGSRSAFNYYMPKIRTMPDMNFNWHDGPNGLTLTPGRGRLGIKAQDTEDGKGVKVLDVDEESAAEKAGVKEGDIITGFDGKKVDNADELSRYAREAQSAQKTSIKITVNRDGKTQTLEVKTPRKLRTANL